MINKKINNDMNMNDAVQKIREVGLLPRVDVKGSEEAFTVGKALVE